MTRTGLIHTLILRSSFAAVMVLGMGAGLVQAATVKAGPVEVQGSAITLGDVFANVGDKSRQIIAPAPQPGQNRVLDARTLAALAKTYQLDWQRQDGADSLVLVRAARKLTANDIAALVLGQLPQDRRRSAMGTVKVALDMPTLELNLPVAGEMKTELQSFRLDSAGQRFSALLRVMLDGEVAAQQSLSGRITTVATIPVLVRPLRNGEVITASDIDWLEVEVNSSGKDAILSADDLIGRTPRQTITAGQPVRPHQVLAPVVVARGSLVTMVYDYNGLQIRSQGKALADAAQGEIVRVANVGSSRTVEAVVVAQGVVRVGPQQDRLAMSAQ
jgi:flagella basal body P-ring formation protein FlgA